MQSFLPEEQTPQDQPSSNPDRAPDKTGEPSLSRQESPLAGASFGESREEGTSLSSEDRKKIASSLNEVVRGIERMEWKLHDLDASSKSTSDLQKSLKSTFNKRLWIGFGAGTASAIALMGVSEAAGPLVFAGVTAYAIVDFVWKSETLLKQAFMKQGKAAGALLSSFFKAAESTSEFQERAQAALGDAKEEAEFGILGQTFRILQEYHPELLTDCSLTAHEVQTLELNPETRRDAGETADSQTELKAGKKFLKAAQHFLEQENGRNRKELEGSLQELERVLHK